MRGGVEVGFIEVDFLRVTGMDGVDDRLIDHFMGHETEEMRRRYQHLFPEDKRKALSQLGY